MKAAYKADEHYKNSKFYIREKLEIAVIAEKLGPWWLRLVIIVLLVIFLYGGMALKYVAGAQSLY